MKIYLVIYIWDVYGHPPGYGGVLGVLSAWHTLEDAVAAAEQVEVREPDVSIRVEAVEVGQNTSAVEVWNDRNGYR